MKLPKTWIQARLGDVLTRVDTRVDPQTSDSASHFYVGLEHIESNTGRLLCDADDVTESSNLLSIKTAFKKGDILYGKLRPNLNKVYLAEQDGICSTDIWALRTTDQLLPEFALQYLRSPAIHVRTAQLAAGANLPRISANAFDRLSAPLPTLPEQKRIIDSLQLAQNLRTIKSNAIQLFTELSNALFEQHFGVAGDSNEWPMEAFGKYTTYSKYGPRFHDQPYSDKGIHILRTTDMNADGTIRWWEAPMLSLTDKQIQEYALKPDTLIISRSGTIGPFALFDGPKNKCVAGAYLIEFGLADSVEPEYIRALFATPYIQQMLVRAVRSMAIPNINVPNIKSILIPIPPYEKQKSFAKQIKALRVWAKANLDSFNKIEELGHVILGDAFTGELTAKWRERHAEEIATAVLARDELLRERGVKLKTASPEPAVSVPKAIESISPARQWLTGELSEFQRQVLAAFIDYPEQPLIVEDENVFITFCDSDEVTERLQIFGEALNNRIRRALSQLAALGLIAQVTLPKINDQTGEREYLKAFRPLREADFSRLSDIESIKRALKPQQEEQFHFLVNLDYETSESAGAGGMFQVISIEDEEGKDFTHLVDQGVHYPSLDELGADLASALKVSQHQIELEEV